MECNRSKLLVKAFSIIVTVFLFGWAAAQGMAAAPTISTSGDATYAYPATVTLKGSLLDHEGGEFDYLWLETVSGGTQPHCAGSITLNANQTVDLPDCSIDGLTIGDHTFLLSVTDKTETVTTSSIPVTITLADNLAPVLAPEVKPMILWPPNNKLVPVVVTPNAFDNSGATPLVTATVTSNEPVKIVGKTKKAGAIWQNPTYNADGTITFMLPAQRLGKGHGRIYTITLTATDGSGNSSTADVRVMVPHDRGKKIK